jgi:hypothetical protein
MSCLLLKVIDATVKKHPGIGSTVKQAAKVPSNINSLAGHTPLSTGQSCEWTNI